MHSFCRRCRMAWWLSLSMLDIHVPVRCAQQYGDIRSKILGQNVKKLIKNGLIIKKPAVVHSRSRAQRHAEAKAKGRHSGIGKRRGTANARMPTKIMWIRRQRVLRRMLKVCPCASRNSARYSAYIYIYIKRVLAPFSEVLPPLIFHVFMFS